MSAERSHLRVTMRHHDDARVKGPLMLVRGQQLEHFPLMLIHNLRVARN